MPACVLPIESRLLQAFVYEGVKAVVHQVIKFGGWRHL